MARVTLLVGSTFGTATETAENVAEQLQQQGHETRVVRRPTLNDIQNPDEVLLVCCATIGQGDVPDSLMSLYCALQDTPPALAGRSLAVIALGDSSYEYFAGGGRQVRELLLDLGACEITPMLVLDALDASRAEDDVAAWVKTLVLTL